MSEREGLGMNSARDEAKLAMAGWNPRRAGEVAGCSGVARMRGASRGSLGGGETLCATRGCSEAVQKGNSDGSAVESSSPEMNQGRRGQRRGVASSGGASRGRDGFQEVPERLGGMPKAVRAAGGQGKPTAAVVAAQRLW